MTLTILSDTDVRSILHSLSLDDVRRLQRNLADALHEYSTGTQDVSGCCSANQPQRAQIKTKDSTTLFMPAKTSSTTGVKIVTLIGQSSSGMKRAPAERQASSTAPTTPKSPSISPSVSFDTRSARASVEKGLSSPRSGNSRSGTPRSGSPAKPSPRSSFSNLALHHPSAASISSISTAQTDRSSSTAGTSLSGSAASTSTSAPSQPSISSSQSTTPQGTLTLLTATGAPLALINAAEVTAFRTALAATLLLSKRARCHTIAVFGAGKQAYWHIRLALLLRGADIHHVRIINRSFAGAEPLLKQIYTSPEWAQLRQSNNKLDFSVLSGEYGEYKRLLKEHVRDADVIFCCTPSVHPLFPAEHLTSSEGRKKGRYLSLIGSYQPHMLEVHPDVLRQAVAPEHKNHHHRHADRGGVVVVDSLEACLQEAGEIIQADLRAEELVEIGEIIMVRKAAMKEVEMGEPGEPGLKRWLESGNVIYKSVGLGLMDLCVGEDLVTLAAERGIGVRVEDF